MFRFDSESMKIKNGYLLIITIIVIFIVFLIFELLVSYFSTFIELGKEKSDWGTFGDFVGGILNPLLSFFGFIALLYTVTIQREALESNDKIQAKQQFESTFFALLNVHNQVLADLSYTPPELPSQNSSRISFIANSINKPKSKLQSIHLEVFIKNVSETVLEENFFWLNQCKEKLQKENDQCGHYFRILYQLLKFIENDAPIGNEKTYSNIVRALLTDNVTELLAVNCYCENEQDTYWQYKLLVERYALFEHAPFHIENSNEKTRPALLEAQNFYDPKAFGQ